MTKMLPSLSALPLILLTLGGCAPVLTGAPGATSDPLAAELDVIFDDPALLHGHWGVLVRSLDTGEVIFSRNAERLFIPASNMKLVTGAAALETLGPDYRYRTTLAAGGPIRNGAIEGPLVVVGTGDPTFGSRFHTRARDVFRIWADSLRSRGISRVAGGIIGVDTAFVDPNLGEGWMWDDLTGSSSAEFGALQFNDGVVEVEIFPSQTVLEPAVVVLTPATQAVRIVNDTRTMPAGSNTAIRIERDESGFGIIIRGEVAADAAGLSRTVAVHGPALYLAAVLRETLREQGISVEGPAVHHSAVGITSPELNQSVPIFAYESPPLSEIVTGMMKPSQNQIAETLLRTVGREMRAEGSADAGAAVVDSLLVAWEFDHRRMRMADGSGLSRYDLLSPALLVELLIRMDESAHRDTWLATLPISGRDGTLAGRMRDPPLREQVLAKTGSLSGVRALSGYLTTQRGERIVFSAIANHYQGSSAQVDRVVEAALGRVATSR